MKKKASRGWGNMNAIARRLEMKRRREVALKNKATRVNQAQILQPLKLRAAIKTIFNRTNNGNTVTDYCNGFLDGWNERNEEIENANRA